jgi:tryptophanyl-tRNA synthetase
MIQFKEKSGTQTRLSLLTYPVLMAADILLHDADEVPVGEDQSQHLELAREVAARFNHRYGPTFVLPRAVTAPVAARVMDLSDPTTKMGKTNASGAGVIGLLDPPEVVRRKVMRAVTDAGTEVRHDPAGQPGVSNLLEILAAVQRAAPDALVFDSYGGLKAAVADAVVEMLRPVRERYTALAAEPGYVRDVLTVGAQRARSRCEATVRRAKEAIGLLTYAA